MRASASCEDRYISKFDGYDFLGPDLQAPLLRLTQWLAQLNTDVQAHHLLCSGLKQSSVLVDQAEAINSLLRTSTAAWARQWTGMEPVRTLANAFDDEVILLVFGKFNAGKSSFCNFLGDRFAASGMVVRYFHLDAGHLVDASEPFKEGVTETTARLQGVHLGDRLVLLDTPGLHSVTAENAELTRRFTDSADGVLWLTSSTSPGQVQELDELSRELRRGKPLLPIITRSDLYEEDEIDNKLVKRLRNKTGPNRSQQEADVRARAEEKMAAIGVDVVQLKAPVSVSVHMARDRGETPAAMEDAGFERLYAALLAMTEPTLAYKRRKPAETLLHHLEEDVLGTLRDRLLPLLAGLKESAQYALDQLQQQRERAINAVWRSVLATLAEILEAHSTTGDVQAVCRSLSQLLISAFARAQHEHFNDCATAPNESLAKISLKEDLGFDNLVVDDGDHRHVVGVDFSYLYTELEKQVRSRTLRLADFALEQCKLTVSGLIERAARVEDLIRARESELFELKAELRTEQPETAGSASRR